MKNMLDLLLIERWNLYRGPLECIEKVLTELTDKITYQLSGKMQIIKQRDHLGM